MTTRLRERHADLHARLNAAAVEGQVSRSDAYLNGKAFWSRRDLLTEARDALLKCPHEKCAYCGAIEKEAQ